jgi:hypothetical protein
VIASAFGQVALQQCSQRFIGNHLVKPLMMPDVFLPKLLDGYPAKFERSEGVNDFVIRVKAEIEQFPAN